MCQPTAVGKRNQDSWFEQNRRPKFPLLCSDCCKRKERDYCLWRSHVHVTGFNEFLQLLPSSILIIWLHTAVCRCTFNENHWTIIYYMWLSIEYSQDIHSCLVINFIQTHSTWPHTKINYEPQTSNRSSKYSTWNTTTDNTLQNCILYIINFLHLLASDGEFWSEGFCVPENDCWGMRHTAPDADFCSH